MPKGALPLPLGGGLRTAAPLDTVKENIFGPFSSLWACDVLLFYSCEAFYVMVLSLDDGEEKDAFVKGFNWVVERPACGGCQLRPGGNMTIRMIQENVSLEGEYNIFLKRYMKVDMETTDEEMSSEKK